MTKTNTKIALGLGLVLIVIGSYFWLTNLTPEPRYDEAWRAQIWQAALCDFFAEKDEKRDVTLLQSALDSALKSEQIESDFSDEKLSVEAGCTLVEQLSERELALLNTLEMMTVLPLPPTQQSSSVSQSLETLIHSYGPFDKGTQKIYEVDPVNQILGYELRLPDTRMYMVYNFSYDVLPLPLPLGFMASTKIAMWRTDAPELQLFVTQGPLSIRAQSAAIVIVE